MIVALVVLCLGVAATHWNGKASSCDHSEDRDCLEHGLDYDSAWVEELRSESEVIGKTAQQVLSMRWDSRKASADFTERSTVAMFIESIDVEGRDMLTEHQLDLLRSTITTFLFYNANNDREHYFSQLLDSQETLSERGKEAIAKDAIKRGRLDVLEMKPLTQLVWLYSETKCDWRGLMAEGTRIRVFTTATGHIEDPGRALFGVVHKVAWDGCKQTNPPVSLVSAAKKRGRILVADVEVFVSNDRHKVMPYFCRYWFDSVDSIWRLETVVTYPVSFWSHGVIVA
jgi:hypothetical protein